MVRIAQPPPEREDIWDMVNEAEGDYWFSVWLGAVVRYLWARKELPLDDYLAKPFQARNALIGWSVTLLLFGLPFLFLVLLVV